MSPTAPGMLVSVGKCSEDRSASFLKGLLSMQTTCAYCGAPFATDREHVFPKCLYPASTSTSKVQRLTVPACNPCNNGWADDEAHFRNVMLLAGEPNDAVNELWHSTAARSFQQIDGSRRVMDLVEMMKSIQTPEGERLMIFPAKDERVMRIIRKIIRGLCHYHNVLSPVRDTQVWADVLKYAIPQVFLDKMSIHHREQNIVHYRYQVLNETGIHSAWLLTFFERRTFIGVVSMSEEGIPPT